MKTLSALLLAAVGGSPILFAGEVYRFEAPAKLLADGMEIVAESPGYASPCLADIDSDGVSDLLVGQFNDGKIAVYKGHKSDKGELTFGKREWLQADGEDAVVPGVW